MILQDRNDERVKRASRLAVANNDFLECEAAVRLAIAKRPSGDGMPYEENNIERRCYITCAIISYARPFSNNKGNGFADPRLAFNKYLSDPGVDQGVHDLVLRLRNKAIAHADFSIVPAQVIDHNQPDMLAIATPVSRPEDELDLDKLESHVTRLIELVQQELHVLSKAMRKEGGKLGPSVELHRQQI